MMGECSCQRIHGRKVMASLKGRDGRPGAHQAGRYPRPKGRGLIEGPPPRECPWPAPGGIHGRKVVASLKGGKQRRNPPNLNQVSTAERSWPHSHHEEREDGHKSQ